MAVATYLADRAPSPASTTNPSRDASGPMIEAGLVGTRGIIELEARYSARTHAEYEDVARDRALGYEWFPMTDDVWDRALENPGAPSVDASG